MKSKMLILSVAILLTAAVISAALGFEKTTLNAELAGNPAEPHGPPAPAKIDTTFKATTADAAVDARVVLLTLRPTGFEPNEVSLPAGEYLLVVRNRSGLDDFGMRLTRESGENLREVRMPKRKRDWKYFLKLTPGNYSLTEIDHLEWNCRLTVTAR